MSRVARSAAAFSIYLGLVAVSLLAVPGTFADLFGLPRGHDLYLRMIGAIAGALAIYFGTSARDENLSFLRASVVARAWVAVAFGAIGIGAGEPALILFGLADASFAAWTWHALRAAVEAPLTG